MSEDSFEGMLENAMNDCLGSSAYSLDRKRPYNGQPHTDHGERGKTEVKGLTMRDISDCFVLGLLDASGLQSKHPVHDDIYKIDLHKIDPGAAIQNAMCHIERFMGIYPNVEKLYNEKGEIL